MDTSKLPGPVGGTRSATDKTAMRVCALAIRSGKTAYLDRPLLQKNQITLHNSCFGTVGVSDVKAAVTRLANDVRLVGDQFLVGGEAETGGYLPFQHTFLPQPCSPPSRTNEWLLPWLI